MTARHRPTVIGRPDASMTLITEVYERPLDPGYAEAAARKAAAEAAPGGSSPAPLGRAGRRLGGFVVAALLGAAVATAAMALHQPASSAVEARKLLEARIEARSADAVALQQQVAALSEEIAALQTELVGPGQSAVISAMEASAVEAGALAVRGPGLRYVLTDAPDDGSGEVDEMSRVQDIDLQVLVNGLWAAGAEAISVNKHRVTATSAIRSAGSAVLVDLVPIVGPYRVEAIGDASAMQTALARDVTGQHLATLKETFGIGVDVSSRDDLLLPGAGQTTLHDATVPDDALPDILRTSAPPRAAGRLPSEGSRVTGSARQWADVPSSARQGGGVLR